MDNDTTSNGMGLPKQRTELHTAIRVAQLELDDLRRDRRADSALAGAVTDALLPHGPGGDALCPHVLALAELLRDRLADCARLAQLERSITALAEEAHSEAPA